MAKRVTPGIKQRGRSYQARWYDPDGKERSKSFPTKAAADDFKKKVEYEKMVGGYVDPRAGRKTVAELGEILLSSKGDRNTAAWYRNMLRHVNDQWGSTPVAKLTHLEIQAWINIFRQSHGQPTVRGVYLTLHEIVRMALHTRLIGHDPCLGIKLPRRTKTEMLFLLPEQVGLLSAAMEDAWPGQGYDTMVRCTVATGCRAGEIGGLKVKHLDLLRNRIRVVAARKTYGGDGETKTHAGRWVDIPPQLSRELAAHLADRPHKPEDRVWTGARGGPLDHHWFYERRFKPVVKDLSERGLLPVREEVDDDGDILFRTLRFHDLRHTCVAMLISKGKQQYHVMEHLGHASIKTTIDIYGHMFPSVHDSIREALSECWDEGFVLAV